MDETIPFETGRRLWQKMAPETAADDALPLEPLLLAGYAEGRLDTATAAAVERRLLTDEAALETLAALANPGHRSIDADRLIARATALVPAGRVVRMSASRPAPRSSGLRAYAAWGAMAASLLVVSLIGFDVGRSAEHAFDTGRYEANTDSSDASMTSFPSDLLS